jgi:hypothetical protein
MVHHSDCTLSKAPGATAALFAAVLCVERRHGC